MLNLNDNFVQLFEEGFFRKSQQCQDWLLKNCHPEFGKSCYFCDSDKISFSDKYEYYCRSCQRTFNVRYRTVMQTSRLSLLPWFSVAGRLLTNDHHGLKVTLLSKEFGMCYRTARILVNKMRMLVDYENQTINFCCRLH